MCTKMIDHASKCSPLLAPEDGFGAARARAVSRIATPM
jgi:hypothetical protein